MRRLILLTAILAITILWLPGMSSVQEKDKTQEEQVKIEGEAVDLGCFTTREARGEGHKACATRCIKNGNPGGHRG